VVTENSSIPLAMLAVFGTAKLLAELFERLRQPAMIGEILAGAIIGPSVLGWVAPNQTISALADLGVMFLLFRVGLEVKPKELMQVGKIALAVAVSGVIAPFVLGWSAMRLWGEPAVESTFVAASLVATSVGITAQVLAARGVLAQRSSRIILAAAVIDDVLAFLVLSVVSSLARGGIRLGDLAVTALLAAGFTFIVANWGSRTVRRMFPHARRGFKAGEVEFNLAMIALFGLALVASYTGVAAIVGAFLAGMALSESLGSRVSLLFLGVSEFLTPFFLAGIGLRLDISVFARPDTLALTALITILAIVSKLMGCGLAASRLGWREALKVGSGMIPRGEVGMVVAQIGLAMRVISPRIYGVVVFVAVLTTILGPAILNLTFSGSSRRYHEETAADDKRPPGPAPWYRAISAYQPFRSINSS
jgi:Kef-type K+ transport system membrane component KefB